MAQFDEPIQNQLSNDGLNINMVTFTYKSHQTNFLSGFENDYENLENVMRLLELKNIPKKEVGIFSLCYGSHVASRYLENNDAKFVIMVEPYIGLNSLKTPLNKFGQILSKMPKNFPKIPIGRRYNKKPGFINFQNLLEVSQYEPDFKNINIPSFIMLTKTHNFFNIPYIFSKLNNENQEFELKEKNSIMGKINLLSKKIEEYSLPLYTNP